MLSKKAHRSKRGRVGGFAANSFKKIGAMERGRRSIAPIFLKRKSSKRGVCAACAPLATFPLGSIIFRHDNMLYAATRSRIENIRGIPDLAEVEGIHHII